MLFHCYSLAQCNVRWLSGTELHVQYMYNNIMLEVTYIPKLQRSLYFQHNSCSTHAALQLLYICIVYTELQCVHVHVHVHVHIHEHVYMYIQWAYTYNAIAKRCAVSGGCLDYRGSTVHVNKSKQGKVNGGTMDVRSVQVHVHLIQGFIHEGERAPAMFPSLRF